MAGDLNVLVGEWDTEIPLPGETVRGHSTVERLGEFLVYRSTVDKPEFPDSVSILDSGAGESHYFDSRGVTRIYESRLEDGVWTLARADDDFHQRFIGEIGEDGRTIRGRWERSDDEGATWEHDFDVIFRRAG
jgi:hypothetical protein